MAGMDAYRALAALFAECGNAGAQKYRWLFVVRNSWAAMCVTNAFACYCRPPVLRLRWRGGVSTGARNTMRKMRS